jgi:hypothetical protein
MRALRWERESRRERGKATDTGRCVVSGMCRQGEEEVSKGELKIFEEAVTMMGQTTASGAGNISR